MTTLLLYTALLGGPDTLAVRFEQPTRVEIELGDGWTVDVSLHHDGAALYATFRNLIHDGHERYPEVLVDPGADAPDADAPDGDAPDGWRATTHWFHASYQDCDATGRFDAYDTCAPTRPGWEANNFPDADTITMRIEFERLGVEPCTVASGRIALHVTDTRGTSAYWPGEARMPEPVGWAVLVSPDRWGCED